MCSPLLDSQNEIHTSQFPNESIEHNGIGSQFDMQIATNPIGGTFAAIPKSNTKILSNYYLQVQRGDHFSRYEVVAGTTIHEEENWETQQLPFELNCLGTIYFSRIQRVKIKSLANQFLRIGLRRIFRRRWWVFRQVFSLPNQKTEVSIWTNVSLAPIISTPKTRALIASP